MTAVLVDQPTTVAIPQDDGSFVILVYAGPAGNQGNPGVDALNDAGFGFTGFAASNALEGVAFAHSLVATDTVSVAYTATPPASIQQVVGLRNNGNIIGSATFAVGENLGTISLMDGTVTFARLDFPSFDAPAVLDDNFTHFAITYAS